MSGFTEQSALLDFGAFRVIWHDEAEDGKRVAAGGDSYVFAVEFTSPPKAYSIMAYSQSSNPKSPHYADQSALFVRDEWKRAWFAEEDVAKNVQQSCGRESAEAALHSLATSAKVFWYVVRRGCGHS